LLEKSPQRDKMGNIATTTLQDKDIKNLALKPKQYRKVVGNPKELYIQVNPKGQRLLRSNLIINLSKSASGERAYLP